MDRTARCHLYIVFEGETQWKSPLFRAHLRGRDSRARCLAALGAQRVFAHALERPHV